MFRYSEAEVQSFHFLFFPGLPPILAFMISEKKRVTVMLHDRLTPRVVDIAVVMKISPNELVNRFVEGCLQQVDQRRKPVDPVPMVDLARQSLQRNLSLADRWLQTQLEKRIRGWAQKTQRWRDLVMEECNLAEDEELTEETILLARRRADKRWKAEGN